MKVMLVVIMLVINLFGAQSKNIKIYTEHYPPHNMKIAGELTGYSVEILDAMFKQMKSKQSIKNIKLTNWSRAYSIALKVPNSMVFSTTKTKQRDDLFKWVGPISKTRVGVIALKSKNIVIKDVSDFNKYKIGAVLKDVAEQLLLKQNVHKNSIQHLNGENAINLSFTKMEKDRIDMFAYNIDAAFDGAKMAGYDISKYEVIYILTEADLYYAFNKKTDAKIIKQWQEALDIIKKNGTYEKIMSKYKRRK
ncbi:substrate-binding periplasmic protein [Sulfurospirillum arcachonense]|uniref:substrate-binding periplasmic protein n=1 Tax=Sulfurospirillum arcachonense TaxID=57666 RepID=UPI000469D4FC|nr:ABC transporter substrate-binding protein [Sulfurospirillum arcachonense]